MAIEDLVYPVVPSRVLDSFDLRVPRRNGRNARVQCSFHFTRNAMALGWSEVHGRLFGQATKLFGEHDLDLVALGGGLPTLPLDFIGDIRRDMDAMAADFALLDQQAAMQRGGPEAEMRHWRAVVYATYENTGGPFAEVHYSAMTDSAITVIDVEHPAWDNATLAHELGHAAGLVPTGLNGVHEAWTKAERRDQIHDVMRPVDAPNGRARNGLIGWTVVALSRAKFCK